MKKNQIAKMSRTDKIIIVLFEISKGTTKKMRFEDVTVALLKKFPSDFSLRGYPKYPDSEGVNHEVYRGGMRKLGLISYSNKVFSLTERGISYAEKTIEKNKSVPTEYHEKLSRFTDKEVKRIALTEGFELFSNNEKDKIVDTDFFNYLGVTARTSRGDFQGRLSVLGEVMKEIKKPKEISPLHRQVLLYHDFLVNKKFRDVIDYFLKK